MAGNKVFDYVVTLKNPTQKFIDYFSIGTILVSLFLFIAQFLVGEERRWIHGIGSLLILLLFGLGLYKSFVRKQAVFYSHVLLITGVIWASMPYYPWLSIPFIVMGLLERQAKKNLEIGFDAEQIVFNNFPRKYYGWQDFSNIVLRDNILTLDYADNRLFQRETIDEEGDADEDEFNAYCQTRLAAVS